MNSFLYKIKPIHLIVLFIIISISLVSYYIYQTIDHSNKLQITINVIPNDSKILLNNNSLKNGINYILPGEYKIIIQRDGFKTIGTTKNIIKTGDEINIALIAQSTEAKNWAQQNINLYSKFATIVDQKAQQDGENILSINPIIKNLPFKNYLYSIGYKSDNSDKTGNSIIITISSSEHYRQAAILQIERWGYNLADFNYEFSNFSNPFKI